MKKKTFFNLISAILLTFVMGSFTAKSVKAETVTNTSNPVIIDLIKSRPRLVVKAGMTPHEYWTTKQGPKDLIVNVGTISDKKTVTFYYATKSGNVDFNHGLGGYSVIKPGMKLMAVISVNLSGLEPKQQYRFKTVDMNLGWNIATPTKNGNLAHGNHMVSVAVPVKIKCHKKHNKKKVKAAKKKVAKVKKINNTKKHPN